MRALWPVSRVGLAFGPKENVDLGIFQTARDNRLVSGEFFPGGVEDGCTKVHRQFEAWRGVSWASSTYLIFKQGHKKSGIWYIAQAQSLIRLSMGIVLRARGAPVPLRAVLVIVLRARVYKTTNGCVGAEGEKS